MRQCWRRQPDDDPASQWASPRFVMVCLKPEVRAVAVFSVIACFACHRRLPQFQVSAYAPGTIYHLARIIGTQRGRAYRQETNTSYSIIRLEYPMVSFLLRSL
jgi:hypothetical protein